MFDIITRLVRDIPAVASEVLVLCLSFLFLLGIGMIFYWFYTRKKIHEMAHQIPASVLKNYLDSIIQNSTALKSSLFRGGGLDIGEGIPSVVPSGNFGPGAQVAVNTDQSAELSRKDAEIYSLNRSIQDKSNVVKDLEKKVGELEGLLSAGGDQTALLGKYQDEINGLKAELELAKNSGGDTSKIEAELSSVTKERDEYKERLMEYEIIEEDLANLKRIQQENEELKAKIAELEKGGAPAPQAAPAPAPEPEPEEEEDLEAAMAAPAIEAAAAPDIPETEGEQKSAEDLLQEFERMLD